VERASHKASVLNGAFHTVALSECLYVLVTGASWHIGNVPHGKRLSKGVTGES